MTGKEKKTEKTSYDLPRELMKEFRQRCLDRNNMPLVQGITEAIKSWLGTDISTTSGTPRKSTTNLQKEPAGAIAFDDKVGVRTKAHGESENLMDALGYILSSNDAQVKSAITSNIWTFRDLLLLREKNARGKPGNPGKPKGSAGQ